MPEHPARRQPNRIANAGKDYPTRLEIRERIISFGKLNHCMLDGPPNPPSYKRKNGHAYDQLDPSNPDRSWRFVLLTQLGHPLIGIRKRQAPRLASKLPGSVL